MPPAGVFLLKVNQHVIASATLKCVNEEAAKKLTECSQLKPHLFQITGCLRQNVHMSFVEIVPYVLEAPFSFLDDDLEKSGAIG